jgi:hypothetical protein
VSADLSEALSLYLRKIGKIIKINIESKRTATPKDFEGIDLNIA